ncbi:nucleoside monophosphate kinase [Candidatus Saccharibacteria bacterium]|nr:nucleoside monophosphate kinase [Candidatus Saccharibacteria bacterium]
MIVFFGPAGAGKSVQGQILAARMGWRWLSAGQLLRDTKDVELLHTMQEGKMVPHEAITKIMGEAISHAANINQLILDGFPRLLQQAQWLIDSQPDHGRAVKLVVVLEVPREELLSRLAIRGRADDTPEAIDERLKIYRQEMYPILNFLTEQNVPVVHIDGTGTVGQVHDRVVAELTSRELS